MFINDLCGGLVIAVFMLVAWCLLELLSFVGCVLLGSLCLLLAGCSWVLVLVVGVVVILFGLLLLVLFVTFVLVVDCFNWLL